MMNREEQNFLGTQRGEGLLGLLVAALLGVMLTTSALQSYFESSYRSFDLQLVSQTRERAKAVLDLMTFDLRMAGAGMPLGQANFQIGTVALGTAPLPVLTSSDATTIAFRRNEKGVVTVLTADYTPASSSLSFSVLSSSDFAVGNQVYISDLSSGGKSGLQGVVQAKTATSVQIQSGYIASPGATFKSGSTVERVNSIFYSTVPVLNLINRDSGGATVTVAPNTSFSLRYFDSTGAVLTPPLTDVIVRDNLAAVEVTVTALSSKEKKDGNFYTAQLRQRVGLRNLYLSR